jgi:hypothetical protein
MRPTKPKRENYKQQRKRMRTPPSNTLRVISDHQIAQFSNALPNPYWSLLIFNPGRHLTKVWINTRHDGHLVATLLDVLRRPLSRKVRSLKEGGTSKKN